MNLADNEQDADMAFQAEETHAGTDVKPFWKQYRLFHAAAAQCTHLVPFYLVI